MAFDLTYLDARVVDRSRVISTDTRLTSAVRYRAINDALAQISLEHDWPWLLTSATITTVAGTATSALPTGFIRTKALIDTVQGTPLRRMSMIEMDETISSGRPAIYHVENGIILKPIPDGVYALLHRYFRAEPDLTTGADVPLIPQVYGRGVVEYAAMLLLKQIRDEEAAMSAAADYAVWLGRSQDNVIQSKEPLRIRVRPGAWF